MTATAAARRYALLLALLYALIYLLPLGARPLGIPDEMRYAEVPREMIVSGNWAAPHLNGLRYFEKPVLGYWLNALAIKAFGENAFAVRLPAVLAAGLTAALIGLLLLRAGGRRETALLGALIYLSTMEVFFVGTFNVLDNLLTLCLTGAFVTFFLAHRAPGPRERRRQLALMGVFCGLAFLTKGFLAFALPVIVIVPFLMWERRWRELLTSAWLPIVTALVVIAPWAIAVQLREPDYWHYFFWVEHIQRFASENAQHAAPFWYFLAYLPALAFPWILQLPATIAGLRRGDGHGENRLVRYLLLWMVVPFLFFSASRGKLATYILPCLPAFAMLTAIGLERALSAGKARLFNAGAWVALVMMALPALYLVAAEGLGAGRPAFAPDETWRWITAVAALAAGGLCLWRSTRSDQTRSRLSWYAAAAVGVFVYWASFLALPHQLADKKAPESFLAHHRDRVTADTLLVTDGTLVHSVDWVFKRNDAYLLDSGELTYGLSYPDARVRDLSGAAFQRFLEFYAGKRPIALFVEDELETDQKALMPPEAQREQQGAFVFWYIPARTQAP